MIAARTENATRKKRRGRNTLSVRDPRIETLLAGLGVPELHLASAREFAKRMHSERNRWDIQRRKGGLFSAKRLSKHDADKSLRHLLANLKGGAND